MINSTLFTIGTALSRAKDAELSVDLLVTGQWMHGYVSAVDGHGVMLIGENDELSVIRLEQVAAVKVLRGSAFLNHPQVESADASSGQRTDLFGDGQKVHPMPAAAADR